MIKSFRRAMIAVLLSGCGAARVQAQCSGYTLEPGPGALGATQSIDSLTTWDPDGSGPASATVVVGGTFGVLMWNGSAWAPVGTLGRPAAGLTSFNGDLLAGTSMYGDEFDSWTVVRWNGAAWVRLGAGPTTMTFTRDFAIHNGALHAISSSSILRFDGTTWQYLGPGFAELAYTVHSFGNELIGGGVLQTSPSGGWYGTVRWLGTGTSWAPVGTGGPGDVVQFATHNGKLEAAGANGVSEWNGTTWQTLGTLPSAKSVVSFNGQLIAGGSFAGGVKRWDGAAWQPLNGGGVAGTSVDVRRMVEWNGELIIAGRFTSAAGQPAGAIARYRCTPCYANCDNSLSAPLLNANDFQCFLNRYASADSYANCDGSTNAPVLNANDFQCYLNQFATGCP